MMHTFRIALLITGAAIMAAPVFAQGIVAPGTKVVLSVEYEYTSTGERKDKYDQNTWSIRRLATVKATLEAQKAQPLPGVHKLEATQTEDLAVKQAAAGRAAQTMQPMMNDMMALMEKCGEDEACLEREVMSYGFGNADTINATREAAAPDFATVSRQDAPRYQMWVATGRQTGAYDIAETMKYIDADPICRIHTDQRCRTTVTRFGKGEIGLPAGIKATDREAAGAAMAELDSVKGTLMLSIPTPMNVLTFEEKVVSDDPETKNSAGPRTIMFPKVKDGAKMLTIPVSGALAGKSGVETVQINASTGGDRTLNETAGEDGVLTIRWSLSAK